MELSSNNIGLWAAQVAIDSPKRDLLTTDEIKSIATILALENAERLLTLKEEQGERPARLYFLKSLHHATMNENADLSIQVSGLNLTKIKSDSEFVQNEKNAAKLSFSLNDSAGADTETDMSDLIADENQLDPADELVQQEALKMTGILRPILTGEVTHPDEWGKMFPDARDLLVETPACRAKAVEPYLDGLGLITGKPREEIRDIISDFFDKWRGARGDYGDGDVEVEDDVRDALRPEPEMAKFFPEESVMKHMLLLKPLEEIKEYAPGFGKSLISLVEREVEELCKQSSISSSNSKELVARLSNFALSYLRFNNGLIKYEAVQERKQQDLFDF